MSMQRIGRWIAPLALTCSLTEIAKADFFEERVFDGSHIFLPTAFALNPAAVQTSYTLFTATRVKKASKVNFTINPNQDNSPVKQNIATEDVGLGGQYPLGGASFGIGYNEFKRLLTAKHINNDVKNEERFFQRDMRMKFAVDLTPELRGGFTFHYTKVQAELDGSYVLTEEDKTRYKGSLTGYGIGLVYEVKSGSCGVFSIPPMRGKATVEGEQKILSEPGIYGLDLALKPNERLAYGFNFYRWSYKHDERDESTTSPLDQRNILLRGLELDQYYRKTGSYGLGVEIAVSPMVFAKAYYHRQSGVYLFDDEAKAGDDGDLESPMAYTEWHAAIGIRNKDFVASISLMQMSAKVGEIEPGRNDVGLREMSGYTRKSSSVGILLGAAF